MTTPAYTPPAIPEALRTPSWPRFGRLVRRMAHRMRIVQATLDLAAIFFIAVAFTQATISAEFMFHCVFVVLVLHAFLFGLRGTLLRIALVSVPLVIYADAGAFGLSEPPLELTEWPLMFVIAALVAWMADRVNSTSKRYAALFRRASERLLTVEESERRRIAGELHDGVGQVLTALTLTLDAAALESDIEVAQTHVAAARGLADSALAETRELAHRMRPARLEERGLVAAVRDLAAQSGFPVEVDADGAAADRHLLSETATVEVFRIVQEALANVVHHSRAERATVSVRRDDQQLSVVIADEGIGFDPGGPNETGIGLAGMRERARLVGGHLAVESAPGSGTRITVSIPATGDPTLP
jgi:signal transduction histidine kinase